MAPIENVHINDNLFSGHLNQQNVTILNKNNLYDLNINRTQIDSVPDYSDKQIIEQFYLTNHTKHKRSINKKLSNNNSTTSSILSQYFSVLSYFVGKNQF